MSGCGAGGADDLGAERDRCAEGLIDGGLAGCAEGDVGAKALNLVAAHWVEIELARALRPIGQLGLGGEGVGGAERGEEGVVELTGGDQIADAHGQMIEHALPPASLPVDMGRTGQAR